MTYYEGSVPEVTEENLKRWKDGICSQPYCVVYALIKELELHRKALELAAYASDFDGWETVPQITAHWLEEAQNAKES